MTAKMSLFSSPPANDAAHRPAMGKKQATQNRLLSRVWNILEKKAICQLFYV
jgi:hypothetical protein